MTVLSCHGKLWFRAIVTKKVYAQSIYTLKCKTDSNSDNFVHNAFFIYLPTSLIIYISANYSALKYFVQIVISKFLFYREVSTVWKFIDGVLNMHFAKTGKST